jgi:MoaA/NifB/PqqE/SkfB family radical SAM enzyme
MSFLKKALLNMYMNIEAKDHELLYLFLEVTRRCNMNCLHCGSDCKNEKSSPEFTTESLFKIVDYCSEHFSPYMAFVITGGEPLVRDDLEAICKRIVERGRRWGMVTNGLLLTPQRFASLEDAGLYSMTISLDGIGATHDRLRNRKGAYEQVLSALSLLGASEASFKDVVTCVYPANLPELDRIGEVLLERGITSWRLFRIFPSGRAKNNSELLLDYDSTMKILDWIAANRPRFQKRGLDVSYSCEGYIPMKVDKRIRAFPFFCRAGINIGAILADGTITGCSNNAECFYEGNIMKDDFATVWNEGFKKFRDRNWMNKGAARTAASSGNVKAVLSTSGTTSNPVRRSATSKIS